MTTQLLTTKLFIPPLRTQLVPRPRRIAAGLSNWEIADELVIAVSTVTSHVNHIYGKLDVKNRVAAVAQTHQLCLF
jgi:LuxR family maltose regulon positive regulatory protein